MTPQNVFAIVLYKNLELDVITLKTHNKLTHIHLLEQLMLEWEKQFRVVFMR